MPLALTVDASAGRLQGSSPLPDSLSQELMRLGCSVETCGWSTLATVIVEKDQAAWRVFRLLMVSGCSIQHGRKLNYEYVEPAGHNMNYVWRHTHRWNAEPSDRETDRFTHEFDISNVRPEQAQTVQAPAPNVVRLEYETPDDGTRTDGQRLIEPEYATPQAVAEISVPALPSLPTEYQQRVEAFIAELRDLLLLSDRPLSADDFDRLLAKAKEITAREDPKYGPHAGLMTFVETALRARKAMQSPSRVTMVGA